MLHFFILGSTIFFFIKVLHFFILPMPMPYHFRIVFSALRNLILCIGNLYYKPYEGDSSSPLFLYLVALTILLTICMYLLTNNYSYFDLLFYITYAYAISF
jgi:hypothetical protein